MKRKIYAGSTSIIEDIFIGDTSSSTGAGLSGLVYNTSGLTAYYKRKGSAPVAITLVTATQGTWTSGGFVAIPNMNGGYELHLPDAAVAAGVRSVLVWIQGAANMSVIPLELELDAVNYQSANSFITGINGIAPPTGWNTAIAQTGDSFARIGNNGSGLTALGDTRIANLDVNVGSRSVFAGGPVSSVTSPVTVGTNNDKTGYGLSSGERDSVATVIESHLLNEGDSQMLINAIVGAIGNTNLSQSAVVAAIRADLERNGGALASILFDYARRTGDYATPANVATAVAALPVPPTANTIANAVALQVGVVSGGGSGVSSKYILSLYVTNNRGEVLSDAVVSVNSNNYRVGSDGYVNTELNLGNYTVTVSLAGYSTVTRTYSLDKNINDSVVML